MIDLVQGSPHGSVASGQASCHVHDRDLFIVPETQTQLRLQDDKRVKIIL